MDNDGLSLAEGSERIRIRGGWWVLRIVRPHVACERWAQWFQDVYIMCVAFDLCGVCGNSPRVLHSGAQPVEITHPVKTHLFLLCTEALGCKRGNSPKE